LERQYCPSRKTLGQSHRPGTSGLRTQDTKAFLHTLGRLLPYTKGSSRPKTDVRNSWNRPIAVIEALPTVLNFIPGCLGRHFEMSLFSGSKKHA
jgi:hypothetical protein